MKSLALGAVLFLAIMAPAAAAECVTSSIVTEADVTASDGDQYKVRAQYYAPDKMAAEFIGDASRLVVIEGQTVWSRHGAEDTAGGLPERLMVIGHQFHALAFRFDEIYEAVEPLRDVDFQGRTYKHGKRGTYGVLTTATLALDGKRPAGLTLALPDGSLVEVAYGDWRKTGKGQPKAPFAIMIAHAGQTYDYRFSKVAFEEAGPMALETAIPAPALEDVVTFRAKEAARAAACAQ